MASRRMLRAGLLAVVVVVGSACGLPPPPQPPPFRCEDHDAAAERFSATCGPDGGPEVDGGGEGELDAGAADAGDLDGGGT